MIGLERRRSANERWQNWKEAEIGSDQLKDRGSGVRRLKRLRAGIDLPAACNLPSSSIASIDQPSQSAAQHRCRFDAVFSFLKVTIYQHELYRVSRPKQVAYRILRTVLGNQIFGSMQCRPKLPTLAQTVQDNLDGPRWSKDLFSQHGPQNSVRNFFGHPLAKTLAS